MFYGQGYETQTHQLVHGDMIIVRNIRDLRHVRVDWTFGELAGKFEDSYSDSETIVHSIVNLGENAE